MDEAFDSVAKRLGTTVETLREFELFGWIYTITKSGRCFLPGELQDKTRLIAHLRQDRKLNPREIADVLNSRLPTLPRTSTDRHMFKAPGSTAIRIHTIRAENREYNFLFFESRIECHDGRRIFFVRTVSGVEPSELHRHEKVLYFGSPEHMEARQNPEMVARFLHKATVQ